MQSDSHRAMKVYERNTGQEVAVCVRELASLLQSVDPLTSSHPGDGLLQACNKGEVVCVCVFVGV